MDIDGKKVKVPSSEGGGVKIKTPTSFLHDEFLVYNEAQIRQRYVVTVVKNSCYCIDVLKKYIYIDDVIINNVKK